MAKKNKKAKVESNKSALDFSNKTYTGILAAAIIFFVAYYYLNGLYTAGTNFQIIRLILGIGITLAAAHCAFWYCMDEKKFLYEKYIPYGVIALLGIFYFLTNKGNWDFGGDSGLYLGLAKSLATFQGYQTIWYPEPYGFTLYGIGLPILLVPAYWLFGMNMFVFNSIIVLTGISAIYFLYKYYLDEMEINILLLFLLAAGLNLWYVRYVAIIMTEIPYFMFLALALIYIKRYEKSEKDISLDFFMLVTMVFMTYQVKAIGIAMYPAVILYFIFKRQYKRSAFILTGITIPFLIWNIRNYMHGSLGYFSYLATVAGAEKGDVEAAQNIAYESYGAIGNLIIKPLEVLYHGGEIFSPMMFSVMTKLSSYPLIYYILFLVAALGFIYKVITKFSAVELTFVIILAAIAIYGGVLYPERWWFVLIPFFLLYMIEGIQFIFQMLKKYSKIEIVDDLKKITIVALLAFTIFTGLSSSDVMITNRSIMTNSSESFIKAAEWVGENTQENSLVSSRLDKEFYLISNRKGGNSRVWHTADITRVTAIEDTVKSRIKYEIAKNNYDYWILDQTRGDSQLIIQVLAKDQVFLNENFQLVYQYPTQNPMSWVLKVKK